MAGPLGVVVVVEMSLAAAAAASSPPLLAAQRRRLQLEIDLVLAGIRNPDCSPISDERAFPRLFSRKKKRISHTCN